MKRSAHTTSSYFVILGIGACFVAWASLFIYNSSFVGIDGRRYFCLIDDAMISMRYAWNFSHGSGLVWNPGEYVEGYTNLLMTLLMSLPALVFDKVNAVLTIQILGIVFVLANAYLVKSIAKHLLTTTTTTTASSRLEERYHRLFVILAFVCALSYYPLVYWSLLGMETGLVAVLLSLSVLCALRYAKEHRPAQGIMVSISLGLAFLTRPDTLVLAVPIFAYALLTGRRSGSKPGLYFLVLMVGVYAGFVVGQELFRWGYYGEWLPNTYTLKVSGIALTSRVENGLIFVSYFLKEVWVLLVVVLVGLAFSFRAEKLLVASPLVVLVCYQVWTGGDVSINWRILSVGIPLMLVLGVHEILMFVHYLSGRAALRRYLLRGPTFLRRHVRGVLTCLLMLGVLLCVNLRFLPEIAMQRDFTDIPINE